MSSTSNKTAWSGRPESASRPSTGFTLLEAYSMLARKAAKSTGVEAPPSGNLHGGDSALYLWRCVVPRREAI
ncbi:MAG: hypothetical protein HYV27_22965 [Candidatus Hydrogenedentes bacterium]|nr:hypothetical protein [Candidatus Hydrogenedentota bacterium]